MSLPRFGEPCEPSWESFLGGKTPEPTHIGCPGGSNIPGLIGGWTCPCECHVVTAPRMDKQSDAPSMESTAQPSSEGSSRG